MRRVPALCCTLVLACGLAACAHDRGGWPTLAPRPAEVRSVAPDPITPVRAAPAQAPKPSIAPDPAAPSALVRLRPRIAAIGVALARALGAAARAPSGSEPWAVAQTELSRAEQLLGDLDDLLPRFGSNAGTPLAPGDARAAREALSRQIEAAKHALARETPFRHYHPVLAR